MLSVPEQPPPERFVTLNPAGAVHSHMSVLSSLPSRPLRESEVADLNRADALELAVATEPDGPTAGLVVAGGAWVKGLAFDGEFTERDGFEGEWTVVQTVELDGTERYEGLRICEGAVRSFLDEG